MDRHEIINLLIEEPKFELFKEAVLGLRSNSLKKQPGKKFFFDLAEIINDRVKHILDDHPNPAIRLQFPKTTISGATLQRYSGFLTYEKEPDDFNKTFIKSKDVFLLFLNRHEALHVSEEFTDDPNISLKRSLCGNWNVYRLSNYISSDPADELQNFKVMCSSLQITLTQSNKLIARFQSLSTWFENGVVDVRTHTLNLAFEKDGKAIEIVTTRINDDTFKRGKIYLNALLRSIQDDEPYTKCCVLQKMPASNDDKGTFTDKVDVVYPPVDNKPLAAPLKDVVEYLIRKKGLFAKQFSPPTIEKIRERNDRFYEDNNRKKFGDLYRILSGKWQSFSADIRDRDNKVLTMRRFSLNKFEFFFDEMNREIYWVSQRGDSGMGPEYVSKGKVEFHDTLIVFTQDEISASAKYPSEQRKIRKVAIVSENEDRMYASTTFIKGINNHSIFELFFKTSGESKADSLDYSDFLKSDLIKDYEKKYLLDRVQHADGWTRFSNVQEEDTQDFELNCAGEYLIYVHNYAPDPKISTQSGSLMQITLQIDKLGFTKEVVVYSNGSKTEYHGQATIAKTIHTLKISNRRTNDSVSDYLFKLENSEPIASLKGINMGIDNRNLPCSDHCLLIRASVFPQATYEPAIVLKGSPVYKWITKHILEKYKKNTTDFFTTIRER